MQDAERSPAKRTVAALVALPVLLVWMHVFLLSIILPTRGWRDKPGGAFQTLTEAWTSPGRSPTAHRCIAVSLGAPGVVSNRS